ncbi:MAG: PilN domain-containing protein, partial [Myxococcota bacterium]
GTVQGAQVWLLGMVIGWAAIGGVCYWLQTIEEDAADAQRKLAAAKNKEADKIKKEIDEEGLKAREEQVKQMRLAKKKLNAKRRTPVFVMYELGMILTDAAQGGGPDRDEEKYRAGIAADPQSAINEKWDPTGLWLGSIEQNGQTLAIEGQARDAADLSEFTRRLRASARFGESSNPDFQREGNPTDEDDARYLSWKLNVQVRRWN